MQVIGPPKAIINYTKNNLQVNFNSTDPEDPNATGLTYSWKFGDGKTRITQSKSFFHTYSQAGTYNVSLTVTDAYGISDTTSASVTVSGCNNCPPLIKVTVSGASEPSPNTFVVSTSAGAGARVPIQVADSRDSSGSTVFTINYHEYRYDLNQSPINIYTNVNVTGDSASIPIPFASTYFYVSVSAYNPKTNLSSIAEARIITNNDTMPVVATKVECFKYYDNGQLIYTGSGQVLIGANDPDSKKIHLGTWYPDQFSGEYTGEFLDNAYRSPSGTFYEFDNYIFNEREYIYPASFEQRNNIRVIYKNSDGKVGYIQIDNTCKL